MGRSKEIATLAAVAAVTTGLIIVDSHMNQDRRGSTPIVSEPTVSPEVNGVALMELIAGYNVDANAAIVFGTPVPSNEIAKFPDNLGKKSVEVAVMPTNSFSTVILNK